MKLTAVFEPAKEGGYTSFIEEFPGVFSEGETVEEARINLHEARKRETQHARRELLPASL